MLSVILRERSDRRISYFANYTQRFFASLRMCKYQKKPPGIFPGVFNLRLNIQQVPPAFQKILQPLQTLGVAPCYLYMHAPGISGVRIYPDDHAFEFAQGLLFRRDIEPELELRALLQGPVGHDEDPAPGDVHYEVGAALVQMAPALDRQADREADLLPSIFAVPFDYLALSIQEKLVHPSLHPDKHLQNAFPGCVFDSLEPLVHTEDL